MEENKVAFGTGIKLWCSICIVAGFLTTTSYFGGSNYLMAVIGIDGLAGYI